MEGQKQRGMYGVGSVIEDESLRINVPSQVETMHCTCKGMAHYWRTFPFDWRGRVMCDRKQC